MSLSRSTFPRPGPARITLALLAVVPAVLGYPWPSTRDRWVLAVAAAAAIVLLGWWRGQHFTTILRRRTAMLRQRRSVRPSRRSGWDLRTTALLRVAPPAEPGVLPLSLIAEYLDRYGLRADAIRITSRDTHSGPEAPSRDTWIGLTFSASRNLAALQGRSPRIPLAETAEVAARRLADHLREIGWETTSVGPGDVPELFGAAARETWRALSDGSGEHVAAYRISVDDALPETLAAVWAHPARETWTAVEFAGAKDRHTVAAGCAFRTDEPPAGAAPLPGLVPQHGTHRFALQALQPLSGQPLEGHTEPADAGVLRWSTAPSAPAAPVSRTHARHAAAGTR